MMSTTQTNSRVRRRQDDGPGFLRVFTTFVVGLAVVVGAGIGVAYVTRSDDTAQTTSARATIPEAGRTSSVTSTTARPAQTAPLEASVIADGSSIDASTTDAATSEVEVSNAGNAVLAADVEQAAVSLDTEETIDPAITYGEAEASFVAKNYEQAAAEFAMFAQQHPGNAWGAYMQGLSLWRAGDTEAAEVAFLTALDIDGSHEKSLVNLARVRLERGAFEEARMPIERALEIDPESVQAHRVYARVLHNLGDREAAARAYQEALRRDPEDPWSLNNYGWMIAEAGRFTESLPPLARAVEVSDELAPSAQAMFQNNLGAALEGAGYYNSAATAYASALQADSTYVRASISLARVEPLRPSQSMPDPDLRELAQQFLETLGNGLAMANETQP